jgi:hypothetical protein
MSEPKPKQYHIFHSTEKEHMFTEEEKQTRVYAGFVMANSLSEAFALSQNETDEEGHHVSWNDTDKSVRSTSVGDIIQDDDGFYLVLNTGFKFLFGNDDPEGAE